MDDVLLVHIHQGRRDLPDNLGGLLLVERTLGDDVIEQFSTTHKFHNNINLLNGDVDIVQLNDMRMVERAERFDLRVELVNHAGEALLDVALVDDLARVGLPVGAVDAAMAGRGRADAEDLADLVLLV